VASALLVPPNRQICEIANFPHNAQVEDSGDNATLFSGSLEMVDDI
jgi:hypothetical protein